MSGRAAVVLGKVRRMIASVLDGRPEVEDAIIDAQVSVVHFILVALKQLIVGEFPGCDPRNRAQTVVLARSTDGGQSFQNYSWTDQPFNAKGGFIGDYNGLAAMNGRVYGIWTEKPESITTRDTIIRIGVADFSTSAAANSSPSPKANLK